MARYIDADALLSKLPNDLPYKGSVKRVLIQAPTEDVAPMSEVERLKGILDSYAFQYGTVTDKQAIIDHERAGVGMNLIKIINTRIDLTNSQAEGISSLYWKGIYDGRKDAYKDIKEIIEQRYAEGI